MIGDNILAKTRNSLTWKVTPGRRSRQEVSTFYELCQLISKTNPKQPPGHNPQRDCHGPIFIYIICSPQKLEMLVWHAGDRNILEFYQGFVSNSLLCISVTRVCGHLRFSFLGQINTR